MKKILFTGGGSAGHVLPNVAIMEELLQKGNVDVCYIGTGGIEKNIISAYPIPYFQITCPKLHRGGSFRAICKNVQIPFAFYRAVKEAERGLKLFSPDAVFSKGGYVALPVVFAAKKLKIPCIAHESDFSLGLANRLSVKKCRYLFTSFPETAQRVRNGKYSGAPLRQNLFSVSKPKARSIFQIPKGAKVILIFGGGSGSLAINGAVRAQLKKLTERYVVLHACGKGNIVQSRMENYRQFEFIKDMGTAYACADLVVARAGAGTVFELLALKKPSILIPLEGATRGDQKQNAEYFRQKGLCKVLPQSELSRLAETVDETFADKALTQRLRESHYTSGNAVIIDALYKI